MAASLKNRTAPAKVIIQRLANSSPSDRLAKALTALGSAIKTLSTSFATFTTKSCAAGFNYDLIAGKPATTWLRAVCSSPAAVSSGQVIWGIMNKASCLSLLSNGVLVLETIQIGQIVGRLREGVRKSATPTCHISPLAFGHIIPNGTYWFDRDPQIADPG